AGTPPSLRLARLSQDPACSSQRAALEHRMHQPAQRCMSAVCSATDSCTAGLHTCTAAALHTAATHPPAAADERRPHCCCHLQEWPPLQHEWPSHLDPPRLPSLPTTA